MKEDGRILRYLSASEPSGPPVAPGFFDASEKSSSLTRLSHPSASFYILLVVRVLSPCSTDSPQYHQYDYSVPQAYNNNGLEDLGGFDRMECQ